MMFTVRVMCMSHAHAHARHRVTYITTYTQKKSQQSSISGDLAREDLAAACLEKVLIVIVRLESL